MLKPVPMEKASLLVLEEDLEALTRRLHEEGIVQLAESPGDSPLQRRALEGLEDEAEALGSRLGNMISVLGEVSADSVEGGNLINKVAALVRRRPSPEPVDVGVVCGEELIAWCSDKVESLSREVDRLAETLGKDTESRSQLDGYLRLARDLSPIKVPLSSFRRSELTCTLFLYLPEDRVEGFSRACREEMDPVHVSVVSGTARRLVMAMCLAADRTKLLTQVHRFEGELIELPPYDQVPREAEKAILEERARLDGEIKGTRDQIRRIGSEHLGTLRVMSEALSVETERIKAFKLFARTESTVLLSGWVREQDVGKLEETVAACTRDRYVLRTSKPTSSELAQVPIGLVNPRPFSSFEWIVRMYGMPNYREIDPTAFVLPTFAVFFGTCLTDAGYGIILTLVSFFILRRLWGEKVGTAFTLCGLATIMMGWLLGGWFGDFLFNPDYGPKLALFKAAWINPLDNPVSLLALALTMGIIHLILGHVTAILAAARKGKLAQGLVTHLGWSFTLGFGSIFILWYLEITKDTSPLWRTLSTWGLAIGFTMGIAGSMWARSGLTRLAGPVEFMYNILAHIADVISYSRLLALGIAGSVNAMLIDYIIIRIAWPNLPAGASPLRMILVVVVCIALSIGFVLLHLANLGLSCLSGFVHTMRLHFAEYFGKFYEGGGEEFTPFKSKRLLTRAEIGEGGA